MYRTQVIKARLTEVTNAMSNVASAVAAFNQEAVSGGAAVQWPNCGNRAAIQTTLGVSLLALSRVAEMAVAPGSGNITATVTRIDGVVDGSTLVLSPSVNTTDSSIFWDWDATSTIRAAYLPRR
jgi:hypothetical protein